MILGIDPGKNHLGMCLYDPSSKRIISWGLYNIDDTCVENFIDSFRDRVSSVLKDDIPRLICIERQPPKNSSMCRLSHYMHVYMVMTYPGVPVTLVPPSKRISYIRRTFPEVPCTSYIQRKKASVEYVRIWLENTTSEWISWFDDQSKQDDCAESFLLCFVSSLDGRQ